MIRLSEKEKQMFLKIGLSSAILDYCETGQLTVNQVYDKAVYHCFENKQEGVIVESLRRCIKCMNSGDAFRRTPEFESLIKLDDEKPATYYERSKLTRAAKEVAQAEAELRDKAKAHGVLQVSARRYAVVHQHSCSWMAMPDCDETDIEGWLVRFDYSFAKDYEGNELKNLLWQDAVAWYERLVRKTNITES